MPLFAIACWFKPNEGDETVDGIAICSDPDTPVTFIFANGEPCRKKAVWNYGLQHYRPWAQFAMPGDE